MNHTIVQYLDKVPGKIGFVYKNLITGDTIEYQAEEEMVAASVIKLYIMVEAFRQMEEGLLKPDQLLSVKREDCVPSCGALTYMHDGVEVTVMDLITLMIILSDNTATNILIDLLGIENINQTMESLGCRVSCLRRKMFDDEKSKQGIQNTINAAETASLLEKLYFGKVISKESSNTMLSIMKNQRLNGKIPFFLHSLKDSPVIAHKTGEDSGVTHDAGIVFARQPFVLSFFGNETDVPVYEQTMAEIARLLYQKQE